MRVFERIVLVAGFATMAFLLWRFDPTLVWTDVSRIGWGFLLVLPFQILDHVLNAWGWKLCFPKEEASRAPFWRLVKIRVAGDGVNYLTPSGTIAGELIRPAMLGGTLSEETRNASVVAAKFAQALGQAFFIMLGLCFFMSERFDLMTVRSRVLGIAGAALAMAFLCGCLAALIVPAADGRLLFWRPPAKLQAVRSLLRAYLLRHPGRFSAAVLAFSGGYAWGALEVLLICGLMGLPLSPMAALAVETLSNIVDSLCFMVPAKVGTQEASKTAIFHALGYPAGQGLAFGLIRHTREFVWACAGFLIYAISRRRRPLSPAPPSPVTL